MFLPFLIYLTFRLHYHLEVLPYHFLFDLKYQLLQLRGNLRQILLENRLLQYLLPLGHHYLIRLTPVAFIPLTISSSINDFVNRNILSFAVIPYNILQYSFNSFTKNGGKETIGEIERNIEESKNHLVDDNMVVKKGMKGITIKLFPQQSLKLIDSNVT